MKITSKAEVLELLQIPFAQFVDDILPEASRNLQQQGEGAIRVMSMLGYSNVCKNQCLYCGMRAGNQVPRYRMEPEQVLELADRARQSGLSRLFLISGEDPKYGFDKILKLADGVRELGLQLSLAAGEFSPEQYRQLAEAGVYEYVIKFEMSHPDSFNRLNPSTSFQKRMKAIEQVRQSGMRLASGNIVGWPGQSLEELADDIMLCRELQISWAPVIPYMPARGTPLAAEGGPGDRQLMLREIALLRILLPSVNITAMQPGDNLQNGLSDLQGNLDALRFGANVVFVDLLPEDRSGDFRVIDRRVLTGREHIEQLSQRSGMRIDW